MKDFMMKILLNLGCFILLLVILIGCEPIAVSVNSDGEVAFTRSEGVFFINLKSGNMTTLDWNYGKDNIPVLVRWSPKGDTLAYTVKKDKDSQDTELNIIDKKGNKKKIYSTSKVITQIEWSENGNNITLAQAGEDSDMNVADLVFVSVKDGMSKVLVQNTGDVHKWYDNNTVALMKIQKKNPDNGDIYQGDLTFYKIDTQETVTLAKLIIARTGSLDCLSAKGNIIFTAIKADGNIGEFDKNMTADSNGYIINLKDKKIDKLIDKVINFMEYSPDGSKILLKAKHEGDYSSKMDLSYFDLKDKSVKVIINNTTDTVSVNSSSVQVYPTWFDNTTVLYWRLSNTYGSNGQAIQLMSVDLSSQKKKNYQAIIDSEIVKLIEAKGGF